MPPSTASWTRATTASATSSWAMCPHHVSTSVSSSTSCVSPCSGCSSVAVRTCTRSPSSSVRPAAIAPCMPVRVNRPHRGLVALVDVLSPHGHPHSSSLTPEPLAGGQPHPRSSAAITESQRRAARLVQPCTRHTTSRGATWGREALRPGRAARAARRSRRVLLRRCADCAQLLVHDEPTWPRRSAAAGVREIPLEAITGTLEPGRAREFDSEFRPSPRMRKRWLRVWVAEHTGPGLGADRGRPGRRRATRSATAITACRSPAPAAR